MITVKNLYNNLLLSYNHYSKKYAITNPLFYLTPNDRVLTWHNYMSKESFYYYEEYYQWVNENLQYSLAISEKALIQIFFEEKDNKICRGSLSFLPHPDLLMSYFRFDMDVDNCSNFYHNTYHINFGYRSDNVRYSLNRFPYPSEFIKFGLFLLGNHEFSHFSKKKFFEDLLSYGESYSHLFDFTIK